MSQPSRCNIFPTRIGSVWTWQEASGARRGLRHEGAVQEGEERREKGRDRVGKAAGNKYVLIPGKRAGWQMRAAPMPLLDAASGEGQSPGR
jgi:hypothetical protein